ncbi:MAG TPA: M1 family metallopeptidase [Candidatus Krumholzibacteria bacterium]|nr:M1 family metallopeptidase [Candidatus Krumholzibacteria bacterium]HPD72442.1 M1 family metallopeptidase [Candidatus Krumholzibacteria bacterium]HRY40626.1 M1 family metallopeptidase [Candidatus Krumholzibacteria bacterium]
MTRAIVCCLLAGGLATAVLAQPAVPHRDLTRLDWEGKHSAVKGPDEGDFAPGSERYDVLRSELDLRLDTGDGSLAGEVKHVFASRDDTLRTVVLDLATGWGLAVSAVTGTSGALPFRHESDALLVRLPAALAEGAVDSLVVAYAGVPDAPTERRGLWLEDHGTGDATAPVFATMCEPAYSRYWWPCKDRPDDKIDRVTMRYTVPDGLVAAAPGLLVAETAPEPGWTTFEWVSSYPIATYLVSVAVSDYVVWQEDCSTPGGTNVLLQHFVYPEHDAWSRVDFGRTCEMIAAGEAWFGPYPFSAEKYGHAEFEWGGAMEHQTCTSWGSGFMTGQGWTHPYVVHELAHQWVGDSLTPRTWADIWLNEGLATYSEALWAEHEGGAAGYRTYLALARSGQDDWSGQGPVYDPVPVFPGRIIYDKGAWIVHMVRGRLDDDDAFFALLEAWAQDGDRPYGTVTTEQFIAHCETYAGEDLAGFFWPYLTTDEVPRLQLRYAVAEGGAAPDTVHLELRQTQATLFDNVYPIHLEAGGERLVTRVRLAERATTATVVLPSADVTISDIAIDPDWWVLWQGGVAAQEPVGLARISPNPVRDGWVSFAYRLESTSSVAIAVYDAMGRQVFRRDLGRVVPDVAGNRYAWDCRTDHGRAASGVFWAALEINGHRTVRTFTVLR